MCSCDTKTCLYYNKNMCTYICTHHKQLKKQKKKWLRKKKELYKKDKK